MPKNTNRALTRAVERSQQFLIEKIEVMDPATLLNGKNLAMYMLTGCSTGRQLAQQLVSDYLSQTIEQNSGWLYEAILEESGLEKVTDKKTDGRHGLDFIQRTNDEIRLVDLAAAPNTKNGGARIKSKSDMADNLAFWQRQNNDNPHIGAKTIVKVWAVARGAPVNRTVRGTDILRVQGDEMWAYFGMGRRFSREIEHELREQRFTPQAIKHLKTSAEDTLIGFLLCGGFLKKRAGTISYTKLLKAYP